MKSEESLPDPTGPKAIRSLLSTPRGSDLADALTKATRRVLRRRFRVVLLLRDAYAQMVTNAPVLDAVWDDLQTTLRLLVAWVKRSYRQVSAASIVLLVAALLYFVTPLDIIPDTLGAIGFVDDVSVISTAVETVRDELDRFRAWEDARVLPS